MHVDFPPSPSSCSITLSRLENLGDEGRCLVVRECCSYWGSMASWVGNIFKRGPEEKYQSA